jgi:hypothetical protein
MFRSLELGPTWTELLAARPAEHPRATGATEQGRKLLLHVPVAVLRWIALRARTLLDRRER